MAKKKYVYKLIPVKEIYLSEYLENIAENNGILDDNLKYYQQIDDGLDVLALVSKVQDDRLLKIIILMMLGYKPREMIEVLDVEDVGEIYNAIQQIRSQFK
jgi:hypothetical protein